MNVQQLTNAMKDSISEIFETMFFMPLEFEEGKAIEDLEKSIDEPMICAQIDFSGPFKGALAVMLPRGLARELSANFLGEDEGAVTEEIVEGTIKEILNMLAGKMLSFYDANLVFDLAIPETAEVSEIKKGVSAGEGRGFEFFISTPDNNFCTKLTVKS